MKRTRLMVAFILLFALLSFGYVQAARAEEAGGAAEMTQADLETQRALQYPFQDFPADAYPKQAEASATQTAAGTDLFHAKFEGDEVSGSGGAVGDKYHFIAEKTDGESWHVKLEANYPTVAGRDYFVTYRFTSDVAGTVKFGDFQEFQITEGENTVTGNFTAKEGTSYLDLQLGMLPAFTIDFTEIEVKEYADEVTYENALPKPIDFKRVSRVYEQHDQGYDTVLVRGDNAINVNYETIPLDLGVWKSRLYVKTGFTPEMGTHYRVTADVMSDRYERNIPFEVLFNDGEIEKGYGALYGQELVPGEVKTCEAVITGNGNGDELILQFSLGEARGGSVIIVGNVHVDKIVDQYTNELPEGFALDTSVATGEIIEEQVPVSYTDLPVPNFFYSGVDTVYEQHDDGYVVNLREGASSATLDITQAPANEGDRGVWKAKLYAATGVSLDPGKSYRIQFDVESAKNQADYEVCFDGDSENAYGALYGRSLTAGGSDHIDMLVTPKSNLGPLTLRLQLGKTDTASGNSITLKNLSVESVDIKYTDVLPSSFSYDTGTAQPQQDEYENVLPSDFSYKTGVNVMEQHDEGYTQEATADGKSATLAITEAPEADRGVWKSKLYINTGVTPEAGKKYAVSFDVAAEKDQAQYEVCFDGATENKYGALYDQVLTAGATQTLRHCFTADESDGPIVLRFQLGNTDDKTGNTVTVSNLKVAEITTGEGTSVLPEDFAYPTAASGEAGYYPVSLPTLTATEAHDEGYEQALDGLTLKITGAPVLNNELWRSKLFVDTGTTLEAGAKYRVTANVTATKAFDFELCYNSGDAEKGYGALYGQGIAAGETKDLISELEVPAGASANNLVLQFNVGKSPKDNTITVNDVKVEKYVPEHEETTVIPEGYNGVDVSLNAAEAHDEGYEQKLSGMTMTITSVPAEQGIWKSKLFVDTGVTPEAGAKYRVTTNVTSAKAFDLEVCYNNGSAEKGYGALYGQTIAAGETKDLVGEFEVSADAATSNLALQLQLGNSPADNTFTVNSVTLEKYQEGSEETKTIPAGYEPVDIAGLTAFEGHDQGYKQSVSGTALNVTEVPSNGVWKSKLFVDTGTALEAGAKYRVTANVTSDKAFDFEVCYNNGDAEKGYGALYGQSIASGETKDLVGEFEVAADADVNNLVLQFQLGNSPAENTFVVNDVTLEKWVDDEDVPAVDPKSFELWAHEDYTASLGGDGNSAIVRFDAVPDGLEVWKTKLFANTGVTLTAGKPYRISADVQADQSLNYEICYNDGGTEKGVGAQYGLTATAETQTVTFETTPDADKSLVIQFSLGNAAAGTTVTVNNVKVEELAETEGDNLMKDSLIVWAPVHEWADAGYETELSNTDSSATAKINSVAADKADWKLKLFVETGAKLMASTKYRIRYKLQADKSFNYNVFLNNGAEEKAVGEFWNLSLGAFEQVVTAANDAVLNIQLMLGETDAPNSVTVSDVQVDKVVGSEGSSVVAPINAWAHEDYATSLSNTDSSASIAITSVPASGREPWKVKLFAETGAQLEAGKTYRVSVDVKATNPMSYDLCFNNQEQEAQLGALYGQEMSAGKSTVTYNVTPEQDSVLFLQLNLGNATGANTVTISGVKVEEVSYASAKNAIAGFRFDSMGCLSKGSDDGYVTSLEKYNSSATFRIKKAPAERHAWNAKVIVDTGITPKAGLGYRVTFDVNAAKSQNLFELFCDGNEELAYGALYEQYLAAGNNTISYTIMPGDSKGPLTLQLRFGETNDTSGNTYTISNFTLEEVEFVTAYNPEIKDACVNDTQDGYTATLKKAANKASVQLVNTPTTVEDGLEAWKNKLFVYTGVVFEPDQKYRVSFNVKSIVPAPFEVCYNKRDEEKGLGAIFGLTSLPEGKYVEYTTYAKEGAQLVIQLSLGNCTAPNTIFLSDVKVEKAGTINLASDTIYHF